LTARTLGRPTLRGFARTGLRVRVQCPARCRAVIRLIVSRRLARRLGTDRTIARVDRTVSTTGSMTVRLRPSRFAASRILRLRRLSATLRLDAIDSRGTRRHAVQNVTLVG
jgi:hypothetical protein